MSILRQQQRLWFLAGAGTGALGLLTLEQDAAEAFGRVAAQLPGAEAPPLTKELPAPIFGQQFWAMAAHNWNLGVDAVFRPIVHELSKRGW